MTRFRLPISLAVSVVILLSAAAAYAYPSLDTKASYPTSSDKGYAFVTANYNYGATTWWGNMASQIRSSAGACCTTSITTIGRNYWNLSTVCGSVATAYQPNLGDNQTPSPSNNYSRASSPLAKGSCAAPSAWYGYETAKHNFNSISAGAWTPITETSYVWR